jgi:hypothetical protein
MARECECLPSLDPLKWHNTTTNSVAYADCCHAMSLGCPISQTWTPHCQDNLSVAGATMSSSTARTEKGQEHDRLAPYLRQQASFVSRLWPWAGAASWGGTTGRRSGRRMGRPTTAKTMVHAWCETSSWTCNSHCASRCRGWCRTNTGGGACSYALCREWGGGRWRHEGREKRSRMANEVVVTEIRTIIIVGRFRWPNGSCLASQSEAWPI